MYIPASYNLRNLWVRKGSTALTVAGIGFVVWIFIMVMAVAQAMRERVSATGEPDNLLITSKDAQYEFSSVILPHDLQVLKTYDGFARDERGRPLLSVETFFASQQPKGTDPAILFIRGIDADHGLKVHSRVRLVQGRIFTPLSREILVGTQLAEKHASLRLGKVIKIGKRDWTIVGIFEAQGSAYESNLLADREDLKINMKMEKDYTVNGKTQNPQAMAAIIHDLENDKRVGLRGRSTQKYFMDQGRTGKQMEALAYVISIIMAVGAVFGAVNTMYAAVAGRSREIGTLRALGFSPRAVLLAFMVECIVIAALGGLVGCALGLATAGVSFELPEEGIGMIKAQAIPTLKLLGGGMGFALIMGVIGGFFPARAAASMDIIRALRKI